LAFMATSVKKERSRRTSWLSPMWRDIDSLRKQNESTKKEIESMRRKSKQTETETEQLRSKSKQIEIETEQLRSETEILKRQNKALELIESNDLNVLLREATIPGGNDSDHSDDQLDLDLLAEKFVALGCDIDDIPFLFDVLELCPVLIDPMLPDFAEVPVHGQGEGPVQTLHLDDQTYQVVPAMVHAELRDGEWQLPALSEVIPTYSITDDLVDFIRHNLHRPLCISDLERQSMYSRRALHYAFRARFACSPMQWVRQQRLARALDRLQNPLQGESVRDVAFACGYLSQTLFSLEFQELYQLKPSEVLRQGRNQNRPTAGDLDPASASVRGRLDDRGETQQPQPPQWFSGNQGPPDLRQEGTVAGQQGQAQTRP
jgi:AraC-like DNA-binding protein